MLMPTYGVAGSAIPPIDIKSHRNKFCNIRGGFHFEC
jgi:hypothetical protein